MWLSTSSDLHLDAERDLSDLGCHIKVINNCQALDQGSKALGLAKDLQEGVLFLTYSTLISQVGGLQAVLAACCGAACTHSNGHVTGQVPLVCRHYCQRHGCPGVWDRSVLPGGARRTDMRHRGLRPLTDLRHRGLRPLAGACVETPSPAPGAGQEQEPAAAGGGVAGRACL